MASTPYSVYFHDARLQRVCLGSVRVLEYQFSLLPVLCHGVNNLREVYGYQAAITVHGVREIKMSLVLQDDDYVIGARIDERDDTEEDGAALLRGELQCVRFGLALGFGRIDCQCAGVALELQTRGKLLESWVESTP